MDSSRGEIYQALRKPSYAIKALKLQNRSTPCFDKVSAIPLALQRTKVVHALANALTN